MTIRSRMSSIMGLIRPEHQELFALELKNAIFHFVYALASTNINQSAPNLVKVYMTIRPRMNSIMGLIGLERPELFALELQESLYLTFLLSSIYNFYPISNLLGQNIYNRKILEEFDCGPNWIRATGVIYP